MQDKRVQDELQRGAGLEIKSLDASGRFAGYASVFSLVDSQRDRMHPGAFAQSLKFRDQPVQLLWQHQWEHPIGVLEQVFEDEHGLYVEGRLLLDVAKAREAHALLKAGALKGLSIGYQSRRSRRDADTGVRELMEVDLFEVSLVTLPANAAAQVTVVKAAQPAQAALLAALERAERILLD